jgi:endonuclease/exonuclease/phosphatase family metal-dependent hydrolase
MGKRAVNKFFYCNVIVITILLAIVTVAGAFADKVSPLYSTTMPFIGLGVVFLLVANVIMVIYWMIRCRWWFVIPLLAIAANYSYLGRIIRLSPSQMVQKTPSLKIATFNCHFFGKEWMPESSRQLAKAMQKEGVDIICLQEYNKGMQSFTSDSLAHVFSEWPYRLQPMPADSSGRLLLAVYSRYPLRSMKYYPFVHTANDAMACDIIVGGQTLRLFNIHLQTTSASSHMGEVRRMGTAELIESISNGFSIVSEDMNECFRMRAVQANYIRKEIDDSPYPVIVCGDFNSMPSSYVYRTILGKDLHDGFCSCGHGYMYTFRYMKRLLRIDYIMTSSSLKGIDYYTLREDFHSDHNPVIMTMQLPHK